MRGRILHVLCKRDVLGAICKDQARRVRKQGENRAVQALRDAERGIFASLEEILGRMRRDCACTAKRGNFFSTRTVFFGKQNQRKDFVSLRYFSFQKAEHGAIRRALRDRNDFSSAHSAVALRQKKAGIASEPYPLIERGRKPKRIANVCLRSHIKRAKAPKELAAEPLVKFSVQLSDAQSDADQRVPSAKQNPCGIVKKRECGGLILEKVSAAEKNVIASAKRKERA